MAGVDKRVVHWFLRVSNINYKYKMAFLTTQSLDIGNLYKKSIQGQARNHRQLTSLTASGVKTMG
jgi:hypothetical protein